MAAELTDERAAFEAWATSLEVQLPVKRHPTFERVYEDDRTTWAWCGFRAANKKATQGAEPEYWQWRRKGQPWSLERTFNSQVFATTADSEVRGLYTAPPPTAEVEKKAARYDWLRALPLFGAWDVTRVRPNREWLIDSLRADDLDAAIDAAIQSDQAQAGKGE